MMMKRGKVAFRYSTATVQDLSELLPLTLSHSAALRVSVNKQGESIVTSYRYLGYPIRAYK